MPSSLPTKTLLVENERYRKDLQREYEALYEGGEKFRRQIDRFLIKRKIEESALAGISGTDLFRERVKWAQYVNRTGGLVDWFKAAVFPDTVRIEAEGDDAYWDSLNLDADGLGKPFAVVLREALVQMLVHNRAYLEVRFPSATADPREAETLQPAMRSLAAGRVLDWDYDYDEREDLDWVKLYDIVPFRPSPFAAPEAEIHRWTIATEREIAIYEAMQGKNGKLPEVALLVSSQPHQLGVCPAIDVRPYPGQWVLSRVRDVAVGLYNAEAALSYAVMMQAYSQPVFRVDSTDLSKAVSHELAAIVLRPGEDMQFVAPNPKQFQAHFDNIRRLKEALYETVQALAINATSIPQAGRLSGQAVAEMRSPLETLVASFSWPVLDAARRWIEAVKRFRGEEGREVTIAGLDQRRADMGELAAALALGDGARSRGPAETKDRDEDEEDGEDQQADR